MRNATKRPIAEWSETDWLTQLGKLACQLTPCAADAADLVHTCLCAFHDRFGYYPWQHPDLTSAWRWCCQKVRSLWVDAHRQAHCHPPLSWEALPEGVACGAVAEIVEGDVDGEAFLASLPKRLREVLELRLAGYSWEEAAQRLGVKARPLRVYFSELRAKLVAFFGYDPSKRGFESLIYMEGENRPSDEALDKTGGDGDEGDGTDGQGFSDDTESAGGG